MVGFVAAFITYKLGVYYLVGAFIAGLVARLMQPRLPALASHQNMQALRLFATFFVPFYFFHAGTGISPDALSLKALGLGLLITVIVVPWRIGMVWLQRRLVFRSETRGEALQVSVALTPTLVFTLVLAETMHSRLNVPGVLTGALVLYTTLNTLLPSLVLGKSFDVMASMAPEAEQAVPETDRAAPVQDESAPAQG